ncbi:hypothetical protein ABEF95_004921 [Exophiala dermatitidis]
MSWASLPPRAGYLALKNGKRRNALSLAVLRDLRDQLHAYNRSPVDGKVRFLPPFKPELLGQLEIASRDPTSEAGQEYGWLLHSSQWLRHREGLPNVIVLRSEGPVFCSGHDLGELKTLSHDEVKETFALCAEVMSLIRRSPVPVIGAIQGLATAAGAQLALTTDLPVAAAATQFRLPGATMGLPCTSPSTAVSRRLGHAFTYRMLALAEPVRADQLPGGAVQVVADQAALEERLAQMVSQLAERTAPQPTALGKWAYWTQLGLNGRESGGDGYEDAVAWTGRVMALHARADDAREGISAFFEKRTPKWKLPPYVLRLKDARILPGIPMAHGEPREVDTVIVGNGPSALILSYILHGNIPYYDESSPHPDHILHDKLVQCTHRGRAEEGDHNCDLLNLDIDSLTEHFTASRFSYSTQALPVNVLFDTLIRPLGETDDAQKKTCVKWRHDPSRAVSHLVIGNTPQAGGQWVDNPVHASWDIGTLSYAGMISLPGYDFDEHYQRRNGKPTPVYLRPSRRAVADYLAAYPDAAGIGDVVINGEQVSGISRQETTGGFYIASHNIACRNLILASGIFSHLIPPPPLLEPLLHLRENSQGIELTGSQSDSSAGLVQSSSDYLLVVGSGFSAADVIISCPPTQKILHVYKWAPSTSPSPLRACHQQAYPEYAGIYRRMKLAAIAALQGEHKRPRARHTHSDFDASRDWGATYEGLPNAEIVDVRLLENENNGVDSNVNNRSAGASSSAAMVTFRIGSAAPFQRRVSDLAYVVGRRGSLDYLAPELLKEVLESPPPATDVWTDNINTNGSSSISNVDIDHSLRDKDSNSINITNNNKDTSSSSSSNPIRTMISGQTLRAKANQDLQVAPHVFIIGSLTGDSLIRFAYGGCAYAAGKIVHPDHFVSNSAGGDSASTDNNDGHSHIHDTSQGSQESSKHGQSNGNNKTDIKSNGSSLVARGDYGSNRDNWSGRGPWVRSRHQTPAASGSASPSGSPSRIPAMNGLDGHERVPTPKTGRSRAASHARG